MDAGTVENQKEVQMAMGGCHRVNHRVMYLEKLNDIIQVHWNQFFMLFCKYGFNKVVVWLWS